MGLSVGIVGLPNVGKSTLFNALTKRQVAVASFPFTTIKPNRAVVPVPDENLAKLAALVKPVKVAPTTIEFIDLAGLVKDAHQGKGLGNRFLGKIREVSLLVEVVRVFADEKVIHVEGKVDPQRDLELVAAELTAAKIQKPIVYLFNIGTGQSFAPAEELGALVVSLADEAATEKLLGQLVSECFRRLDLITFYTLAGGQEVRAVKLKRGENILAAAAKIHSDFAKNFIKAEVVESGKLLAAGSWQQARAEGLLRTVGRDYLVQDGEVVEFKI